VPFICRKYIAEHQVIGEKLMNVKDSGEGGLWTDCRGLLEDNTPAAVSRVSEKTRKCWVSLERLRQASVRRTSNTGEIWTRQLPATRTFKFYNVTANFPGKEISVIHLPLNRIRRSVVVTEVTICCKEASTLTIYIIVHTVRHVPHYPFIYQLSCTASRFFTHILVLAPTRFGVNNTFRELQSNYNSFTKHQTFTHPI
jgi:hypothetical protein